MKKKKKWPIVIVAILVIWGISSVSSCGSNSEKTNNQTAQSNGAEQAAAPEAQPEEVLAVSAADLLAAYAENEISADTAYKGKTLAVTGVAENIAKDMLDDPYITIGAGEEVALTSVQCYFDEKNTAEMEKVSTAKPGNQITIVGKCDGSFMNISLKGCTIR